MKSAICAALLAAFCLTVSFAQAPANDECAGAMTLMLGVNPAPAASGNFYTSVGSTTGVNVASCQASNSDVWFVFTPNLTGDYVFSTNTPAGFTAGTLTNTVLSVYDACPAVNELACDNDNAAGTRSVVRVPNMLAGVPYYVRVADQAATVATGTFYVVVIPAVTNDECSGAIAVGTGINPAPGASGSVFTNEGATNSAGIVSACPTGTTGSNSDVWFSFVAPGNGTYVISTDTPTGFVSGSMTDTVLSIWSSCGPGMVEVACDDDGGTVGALLSTATVNGLIGGNTYYIRVAEYSVATTSVDQGSFYLTITPKFELAFSSPFGAGSIQIDLTNGPPNGNYYFAVTLAQGLFPNGWIYGLDIGLSDIVSQVNSGYPFVGSLNAGGGTTIGPISGAPNGLTVYAVGLGFNSGLGTPDVHTQALSYVIP
jgi:hypothetical protein